MCRVELGNVSLVFLLFVVLYCIYLLVLGEVNYLFCYIWGILYAFSLFFFLSLSLLFVCICVVFCVCAVYILCVRVSFMKESLSYRNTF